MMSMELYYRAIRAMPEEWISDDTASCRYGEDSVIATNPHRKAQIFRRATMAWEELDLATGKPKERLKF